MLSFLKKSQHILGINARNLNYLRPSNSLRAIRIADNKLLTKKILRKASLPILQNYGLIRQIKELKGFKKILLKPGESTTISLTIAPEHLSFTNINKEFVVEPGEFEIMVGNSSLDKDLEKVILQVI